MKLREKLSKREASGASILIFIILTIQVVFFLFNLPDKKHSGRNGEEERDRQELTADEINPDKKDSSDVRLSEFPKPERGEHELFTFDPNTVTVEELVQLGLSEKQAVTIINYRSAGGRFRKREDFLKMYVVSDAFYEYVKEYIVIVGNPDIVPASTVSTSHEKSVSYENGRSDISPITSEKENISRKDTIFRENPVRKEKLLPLEINYADSLSLLSLPGIGPYYASRILVYRSLTGGFYHKEQLMEISGIDEERYSMFQESIYADTAHMLRKDLGIISREDISAHPYIGAYLARSIVRFRDQIQNEKITLGLLLENRIINNELFEILKYYFQ